MLSPNRRLSTNWRKRRQFKAPVSTLNSCQDVKFRCEMGTVGPNFPWGSESIQWQLQTFLRFEDYWVCMLGYVLRASYVFYFLPPFISYPLFIFIFSFSVSVCISLSVCLFLHPPSLYLGHSILDNVLPGNPGCSWTFFCPNLLSTRTVGIVFFF